MWREKEYTKKMKRGDELLRDSENALWERI
jgi:hypothetical protein